MNTMRPHNFIILLLLPLGLALACSPAARKQTRFMEEQGIDTTTRELQLQLYRYGAQFAGKVELAADEIRSKTTDAHIRENALLWKTNAVPEMMSECFKTDPLAGLLGAWAFAVEMRTYYDKGAGRDIFGDLQPIAVDTSWELEGAIADLAASIVGEDRFTQASAKVDKWATEHPIRNQLFVREGMNPKLIKQVASTEASGGLAAASSINEQMLAMNDRMGIMTAYLPRQVQWQSELMMARGESMIADVRDSTITAAMGSLDPIFSFMDGERAKLAEDVSRERAAVLEGIATERLAVLTALADERTAVLNRIAQERTLTMEQLNTLTLEAIERVVAQSEQVAGASIDRLFRRTAQLMAIPFLLTIVAFAMLVVGFRNMMNRFFELKTAERRDGARG